MTYANADGSGDGMTTGKTGSSGASFSRRLLAVCLLDVGLAAR